MRPQAPSALWVAISMRRLSKRSAKTPAQSVSSSVGMNCSATATPSAAGLPPESSSTSQSCAARCIHVPVSDTTWPEA